MDPKPLRIFTFHDTPRLRYIAGILFGEILGIQWEITSDKRRIKKCPVINYSEEILEGAFSIKPDGLLCEKGITHKDVRISSWKGLPVFFSGYSTDIPFDIFAASFYLISRYEEYLEFDQQGRFNFSSSLAYQYGFLDIPIVDLWTREMAKGLLKKFNSLTFRRNEFRSAALIDSDNVFSNGSGGLLSSLWNITGRIMKSNSVDIQDSFAYIYEAAGNSSMELKFFFSVGKHPRFDTNPSWKNATYRSLINEVASKSGTGVYTSFHVHEKKLASTEVGRIEKIIGFKVKMNRFHSQKFFLPQSYRMLLHEGIKEDYSMGYTDIPGFRAGISRPFYFYDIHEERETTLRVFPVLFTDDSISRQGQSIEDSKLLLNSLIKKTRNAGGLFTSSWHACNFHRPATRNTFREMFRLMIKYQGDDSISQE